MKKEKGSLNSFDPAWHILEAVKFSGLCMLIAYLIYNSVWGVLPAIPVCVLLYRKDVQAAKEKKKDQLTVEFKDFLVMLAGELNAGRSLETAIIRLSENYTGTGPAAALMKKALLVMAHGLTLSRTPEQLIREMGKRNGIKEIMDFAGLISINKYYGGEMSAVTRRTADGIADRQMLLSEVQTMVAAKRLESMVMVATPFAIIAYMRLTNPGYMEMMYDTLPGKLVMTVSLSLVLLSALLTDRVLKKLK